MISRTPPRRAAQQQLAVRAALARGHRPRAAENVVEYMLSEKSLAD